MHHLDLQPGPKFLLAGPLPPRVPHLAPEHRPGPDGQAREHSQFGQGAVEADLQTVGLEPQSEGETQQAGQGDQQVQCFDREGLFRER